MSEYLINVYGDIEIHFDAAPNAIIQTILKNNRWQCLAQGKIWINNYTQTNLYWAEVLILESAHELCKEDFEELTNYINGLSLKELNEENFEDDELVNIDENDRAFIFGYNDIIYILNKDDHVGHNLNVISGKISICDRNAILQTTITPLYFCGRCQKYYIDPIMLKCIKAKGVPLVTIVSNVEEFNNLQEESPLYLMGYNVSQQSGLTSDQRRYILRYIYENGYMSKERIISYLNWFISRHSGGEIAEGKWQSDIDYLENIN